MKLRRMAIDSLVILLLPMSISYPAFAQERPARTGDSLFYELIVSEHPNAPKSTRFTRTLEITPTGDRIHLFADKVRKEVFDKNHALKENPTSVLDKNAQFVRVPDGLEIGKKWTTTYTTPTSIGSCNSVRRSLQGVAESGPDFRLEIDGKEETIKTVTIDYKGWWNCTGNHHNGRLEIKILYSPLLNEIVSHAATWTEDGAPQGETKRMLKRIVGPKNFKQPQ